MNNNPVTNAFFFGRALAEVMSEKMEESFTNAMSELGKFDAEQRENLRQFMEEVQLRAEAAGTTTTTTTTTTTRTTYPTSNNGSNGSVSNSPSTYTSVNIDTSSTNSDDLQTMLDSLRAEIATLRSELNKYRQ